MKTYRVLFLNQVAGPLFRELVSDVAKQIGPCSILTGKAEISRRPLGPHVQLLQAPSYDRSSTVRRVCSWMSFFFVALRYALFDSRAAAMLLVSNPPFLGLVGWLAAVIRGRRYVVLVYDLYPGMLVKLGRIPARGLLARVWHWFNRLIWARSACIITIGEVMSANIRAQFPAGSTQPEVIVIPNWADPTFIRPVPRSENPFVIRHELQDKFTVLYSGNLGNSHDLGVLLDAAAAMRASMNVAFLIIGAGVQYGIIERRIKNDGLSNVRLLPLQPEADLPWTLTSGDVAVVSFERGSEGYMVPSKTYYYLAAGCAILVIAKHDNEVSRLVRAHGCGLVAAPDNLEAITQALWRFRNDMDFRVSCQRAARACAEKIFTRRNGTTHYAAILRRVLEGSSS